MSDHRTVAVCPTCGFERSFAWEQDPRYETPTVVVAHEGHGLHSYQLVAPSGAVSLRTGPAKLVFDEAPQPRVGFDG